MARTLIQRSLLVRRLIIMVDRIKQLVVSCVGDVLVQTKRHLFGFGYRNEFLDAADLSADRCITRYFNVNGVELLLKASGSIIS